MNRGVANYNYAKHIDSFQKLRFLLFLHEHPEMAGTSQEFAERLYFGHTPLLDKIITDLHRAGFVDQVENCYKLRNEAEIMSYLQHLAWAFEDPLARQQMLEQIRHRASLPH